ncbi:Hypothetical predicted protein [Marmota monax]|uniref:Uncharacterized protein n=1 Tax=Marmota monax TaxID=9995 RepID=A0A5E4ADI5_MARMO|nr:Hypothetical predicted protein [Marmota monax]
MEPQHPLVSGSQEGEGTGTREEEPFLCTDRNLGAHSSHFTKPRGLFGLGLHNAGYFHPDVLCHHRLGHSVLHYLSALVAGFAARSLRENSSEGKNGAEGPSILLADAPVDFCFCSCLQSNKRPLINNSSPAAQQTSSRAFRTWLTPGKQGAL